VLTGSAHYARMRSKQKSLLATQEEEYVLEIYAKDILYNGDHDWSTEHKMIKMLDAKHTAQ